MTSVGIPGAPADAEFTNAMKALRSRSRWSAALVLLVSFALFILVRQQQSGSTRGLVILLGVLLFHELGHYAGMRVFGYRDVRMFFIPFFGAAVSGKRGDVAPWKEGIVLLLGPVPGIAVAFALAMNGAITSPGVRPVAFSLVTINAFNLLPLAGLDGARLLQHVLFSRRRWLEVLFQLCVALALAAVGIKTEVWALLAFAYGNRLCTADALAGKNFYPWPGMLAAIERRYGLADTKLSFDMLRSEHIPFNFFVPLRGHAAMTQLAREWSGVEVAQIVSVEIERAPTPKARFLDDNTSFDAYVEYRAKDGTRGAIGVEVKFTESEYPWGRTERTRMFADRSRYLLVHEASGIYGPGSLELLRTPRFKQLWRNQLLGEAMLQYPKLGVEHFTSVLLYPSGNTHFVEVTREYEKMQVPARTSACFRGVTFEDFIVTCRKQAHVTTATELTAERIPTGGASCRCPSPGSRAAPSARPCRRSPPPAPAGRTAGTPGRTARTLPRRSAPSPPPLRRSPGPRASRRTRGRPETWRRATARSTRSRAPGRPGCSSS